MKLTSMLRGLLSLALAMLLVVPPAMAAANRQLPTSSSTGPISGPVYMNAVAEEVTALWNAAPLQLSSVGGTADAITASVTPALTGSLVDGMAFFITPTSTNTGAVTLNVGGTGAISVVSASGSALTAGAMTSGTTYLLLYRGSANKFALMTSGGGGSSASGGFIGRQIFTSSGTYTPSAGMNHCWVIVVGGTGGGAGGTSGGTGGTTSVGSLITAVGGTGGNYSGTGGAGGTGGTGGQLRVAGQRGGSFDSWSGSTTRPRAGGQSGLGLSSGGEGLASPGSTSSAAASGGGAEAAGGWFSAASVGASKTVTIGAAGSAGTSASPGAGGLVIIEEYY